MIAEMAIPAALCLALYSCILSDVQHHRAPSSFTIPSSPALSSPSSSASPPSYIYGLANPNGDAAVEATKHKAIAFSVGVLLVAFVLRILLLLSAASTPESIRLVFLCFAAVAMAAFCFLPLKVGESSGPVAGERAPDYPVAVENQV